MAASVYYISIQIFSFLVLQNKSKMHLYAKCKCIAENANVPKVVHIKIMGKIYKKLTRTENSFQDLGF